jgi:hypothetical protein
VKQKKVAVHKLPTRREFVNGDLLGLPRLIAQGFRANACAPALLNLLMGLYHTAKGVGVNGVLFAILKNSASLVSNINF